MITSLIRQHPRLSLAIGLLLFLLAIAVLVAIFALSRVYAMPPQPLPFQHSKQNPKDQADIEAVIRQWNSGQPVRWTKVNDQPDFVQFNHRPHIAAGVACESCHGDIAVMTYAKPYNLNMGFCLDCHRKQAAEKVARLIDCGTCHY
jgi:hypothetical protein